MSPGFPGCVCRSSCSDQWFSQGMPRTSGVHGAPHPQSPGVYLSPTFPGGFNLCLLRKIQQATVVSTLFPRSLSHLMSWDRSRWSQCHCLVGPSAHQPVYLLPLCKGISPSLNWENQLVQGKDQASNPTAVTAASCVPGRACISLLRNLFSSPMERV